MKFNEMTISELQAALPKQLVIRVAESPTDNRYIGKIYEGEKLYLVGDPKADPNEAARDVVHLWMH